MSKYALESNDTKALMEQASQRNILNGKNIALLISYCLILEKYCAISLGGQYLINFPTSTIVSSESLVEELCKLANEWLRVDEDLKLAGIGNLRAHIDNRINGFYTPPVSKKQIQSYVRQENISLEAQFQRHSELECLREDLEEFHLDLMDVEEMYNVTGAKTIAIENFTNYCLLQVQSILQKACAALAETITSCIEVSPKRVPLLSHLKKNLEFIDMEETKKITTGRAGRS